LVAGLLALALAGCQTVAGLLPTTPPASPTATRRPTSTPFRLPPTFTPRPSPTRPITPTATVIEGTHTPHPTARATMTGTPPSPTPRRIATATPYMTATATAFPNGTRYGFGGLCADGTPMPCLYSSGLAVVDGQQVLRYVFENIPYPGTFYVEINGAALNCHTLPDYPTRAYCTGRVPVQTPIQLRLGWTEPDGRPIEVYVDPAVVEAVRQRGFFPLGP